MILKKNVMKRINFDNFKSHFEFGSSGGLHKLNRLLFRVGNSRHADSLFVARETCGGSFLKV